MQEMPDCLFESPAGFVSISESFNSNLKEKVYVFPEEGLVSFFPKKLSNKVRIIIQAVLKTENYPQEKEMFLAFLTKFANFYNPCFFDTFIVECLDEDICRHSLDPYIVSLPSGDKMRVSRDPFLPRNFRAFIEVSVYNVENGTNLNLGIEMISRLQNLRNLPVFRSIKITTYLDDEDSFCCPGISIYEDLSI